MRTPVVVRQAASAGGLLISAATILTVAPWSIALAAPAPIRIEIASREAAFGGASFGPHGEYEQIKGIARLAVDPRAPENRAIADLRHAPRGPDGLVHYDVDVAILRPRDPARARRVMIYDVVNRGTRVVTGLNRGSRGDSFLMRQGYTIVWSGWQGDLADPGLIGARLPVATLRGRPITGRISTEANIADRKGGRIVLPYAAASRDGTNATLTVRARTGDPERPLPAASWRFVDDRTVEVVPPADMDAGALYRFSYVARDPRVMGLGFAAVRDVVAFLRQGSVADGNPLGDIAGATCGPGCNGGFEAVVAYGASQSGRFLRDFVWQGFNRAAGGGRVFDGMIALIPGARRTFTNQRFSEPGRFSRQHEDHDVPGFDFPFAYGRVRDPVSGREDGILNRCTADSSCPRIFHIDSSAEFWQAGASLVGTGGTERDLPFPPSVRAYMIAGGAHAPGMSLPICRYPANALDYSPVLRALLVRMVDWTTGRAEPPASRWPGRADGGLRDPASFDPPDLRAAGLVWPSVVNRPMAPAGSPGWPVLVPRVDADGNDVGGIAVPAFAAPAGTYLGWNLRQPGFAAGELCNIFGGYVPFAAEEESRGADPRPSMARRYPDGTRAARMRAAAAALHRDGLLLDEDLDTQSAPMPD